MKPYREIPDSEIKAELARIQGGIFNDASLAGWWLIAIVVGLQIAIIVLDNTIAKLLITFLMGIGSALAYLLVITIVIIITVVTFWERGAGSGISAKLMQSGVNKTYRSAVSVVTSAIDKVNSESSSRACQECGNTQHKSAEWVYCSKCGYKRNADEIGGRK
jgi:ribosomal protein L37E